MSCSNNVPTCLCQACRNARAALEQGKTYDELHSEYGHPAAGMIKEAAATQRLRAFLEALAEDLTYYWHWGDGDGGWFLEQLAIAVEQTGRPWPHYVPRLHAVLRDSTYRKQAVPRRLAKQVFERDAYRCVTCGTHIDLTCDHIVPESKGGPTTLENLQTMCRPCNSKKGARL